MRWRTSMRRIAISCSSSCRPDTGTPAHFTSPCPPRGRRTFLLDSSPTRDRKAGFLVLSRHGHAHCFPQRRQRYAQLVGPTVHSLKPAFAINTGDVVNDGKIDAQIDDYGKVIRLSPIPMYSVPGNHDLNSPVNRHYAEVIGPERYAFDYGGRHFLILNSIRDVERQYEWMKRGTGAPTARKGGARLPALPAGQEAHGFSGQVQDASHFHGPPAL